MEYESLVVATEVNADIHCYVQSIYLIILEV